MIFAKRLNILVSDIVSGSSDEEHIGTRIQVASQTDFENGELLADKTVKSPSDIRRIPIDIEIDPNSCIYVRHAFLFRNKTTGQERFNPFGLITPVKGNQQGFKFNDIILTTPYVTTEVNTSDVNTSYCKVNIEGFKTLVGVGKHIATDWLFVDDNGVTVYQREMDKDNLTSILVPYNLFDSTKMYFLKARFITDTNGYSNYGMYLLNSITTEKLLYNLDPVEPFTYGKNLFFDVTYKSSNITQVAVIIKKVNPDGTEEDVYRKVDYEPTRSIDVKSDALIVGATYKVYSYAVVNINGKVYNTTTGLYYTFTFIEDDRYSVSPVADYPGKYTTLNKLVVGGMVTVTRELKNGNYAIVKNTSNKISIFGKYNNTIKDTGVEFEIPNIEGSDVSIPYINILPLFNDYVMVNYCVPKSKEFTFSKWAIYKHDLVTNKFKLIDIYNSVDELYSTSMCSSAVVAKDNSVYYIPARSITPFQFETNKALPLYRIYLDANQKLTREVIKETLISGVYRNLTMCSAGDRTSGQEEFIILGGTNYTANPIRDSNRELTGNYDWRLVNTNIYKYSVATKNLVNIGSLPTSFNKSKYALSAFLRKDGKIVVFNNSDQTEAYKDSSTFTLDLTKNGTDMFTQEDNDSKLDIPFRTTMVATNGDFIRIGYNDELIVPTLYYPASKLASYTDDSASIVKHLIVPIGRTITIENPYLYEKITIEGTSEDSTGVLNWTDKNTVRRLDYRDVIITRDTTMTQAQVDKIEKTHLWILDGVNLTITN